MMNAKQNWLETIKKDGKPEGLVAQYSPNHLIISDPIYPLDFGKRSRGCRCKDWFGVDVIWPEEQAGAMPGQPICDDITEWKKYIKVPDASSVIEGWEAAKEEVALINREEENVMCFMGAGIFERMHFLLGFENALISLLSEPEDTMELVEAIGEYRFQYAKRLVEELHPDTIVSHDDWGSKKSMFFSPEIFREYFKPQYKKIYGYLKDNGVVILHHADSFLEPIVDDMVDIGIDIWQGALPENDIPALQKHLGGNMVIMGGIDASRVDRADVTEEQIRAEVRKTCDLYAPGGHFIPCLTYGRGVSIFENVYNTIDDEIINWNKQHS